MLRPLLDLLLPVECAGCGLPGAVLCPDCEVLVRAPVRVYPPCCAAGPPVYALGAYRGRLRAVLLAYKERGRRDLAGPLGGALAAALLQLRSQPGRRPSGICLVPVPSRRAAAARRGGQH
nr:ComF family protein [Actinomycetota bacterium]